LRGLLHSNNGLIETKLKLKVCDKTILKIMNKLGFKIFGQDVSEHLKVISAQITPNLAKYIVSCLKRVKKNVKEEKLLVAKMQKKLAGRKFKNPLDIRRPKTLPKELLFAEGTLVATRQAAGAFFTWLMKETAFFWAGAGDLSRSVSTHQTEEVYGLINSKNKLGRGIRYGIAEQNMAMMGSGMTLDRLPGGFAPISVFASFAAFTPMMGNAVRLSVYGNQINPKQKGFFIMLSSHDGPETGEDGPTQQGLYWMSLFNAFPGIKVYKPLDANETIEMLFYALEKGEPIALSVARPETSVFVRGNDVAPAREATKGAYIFKNFRENNNKKITLAVCGGMMLANLLEIVPALESSVLNIKIVAVTSTELFAEFKIEHPVEAEQIFSTEDRTRAIVIHNGWKGFLYPFLLPADYTDRTIAIDTFLQSGTVKEVYDLAGFSAVQLKEKINLICKG